jgi:hypothetical protein
VTLTQDVVLSTSALTDISGLVFSLDTVSATYAFEFEIIHQSAVTSNAQMQPTVSTPGFSRFSAQFFVPNTGAVAGGSTSDWQQTINASGTKVAATTAPALAVDLYSFVKGLIVVSTTGTLRFKAANNVSGATSIVTIKAGSSGKLWRIA